MRVAHSGTKSTPSGSTRRALSSCSATSCGVDAKRYFSYLGITNADIKYSESIGSGDKDIIKSVSSVKEAVSYSSIGAALNAIDKGTPIKMIGFKAVEPTVANVENGTVPITFDMTLVAKKTVDGAKKAFLEFAAQDHADINKKVHFAPVKK